jgi:ABC-2 type transport system permease protein
MKNMHLYLQTFRFNVRIASVYKAELFSFLLRQVLLLFFLMLFWFVLSQNHPAVFDIKQIVSYFLIGLGISELGMSSTYSFGRNIQKQVKRGEFSNVLIKPVRTLTHTYTAFLGYDFYTILYALLSCILGIAIYPPQSFLNVLLFIMFLFMSISIGFALNVLIAVVGFYSPEAGSIKNTLRHISKILSGALVPLSYFPSTLQTIVSYTPFPSLVFYPTIALQKGTDGFPVIKTFLITFFWVLLLSVASKYLWDRAIKNYDGVGL